MDGTDPRSATGGDLRQVADTTIGEVSAPEVKVSSLPKPTTESSPKSEPVTTGSEVDTGQQGRDTRRHDRSQREPVATDSEVETGKQGRDTRRHGRGRWERATAGSEVETGQQGRDTRRHDRGQREPVTTDSETNPPGQSAPQSEAPARDQPPDHSAETTKGDHAVHGEGGRDG